MFERITIDPKVCSGVACVKGTRIPVSLVLGMLAGGETVDSVTEAYAPSLARADVLACLGFAAALAQRATLADLEAAPSKEAELAEVEG